MSGEDTNEEQATKARYPEHAKLDAVQEQVSACIRFMEWLQEGGLDETLPEGSDGYGFVDLCYRPLIKTKEVPPAPDRRSAHPGAYARQGIQARSCHSQREARVRRAARILPAVRPV